MSDLKAMVLKRAKDKDWVPTRELLDEIGKQLHEMPIKDSLRDWWSVMTMTYLGGREGATRKTRSANQLLLLAEQPQAKDTDDWNLDW